MTVLPSVVVCNTQADADPNYYLQNVSGSVMRRRCAPGSHYDSGSCGCSILVTVTPATGKDFLRNTVA